MVANSAARTPGERNGVSDDTHADSQLLSLRRQPRNQRHALEKLATGGYRQRFRKPIHHAEGVLQFIPDRRPPAQ